MIINIYSVYDHQAEMYNSPYGVVNDNVAKRAFWEACKDPRTDLHKFPNDYSLYNIATFDDATGRYENVIPPKCVTTANAPRVHEYIEKEIEAINEENHEKIEKAREAVLENGDKKL